MEKEQYRYIVFGIVFLHLILSAIFFAYVCKKQHCDEKVISNERNIETEMERRKKRSKEGGKELKRRSSNSKEKKQEKPIEDAWAGRD